MRETDTPEVACLPTEELRDDPSSLNEGVCMFSFTQDHYSLFRRLKRLLDEERFQLENLDVSTQVIDINPQHYTAWYFRRKVIQANYSECEEIDRTQFLREELRFVRGVCDRAPKCYQSWWHLRQVREWLGFDPEELEFASRQLERDAKNMYVWSHRTWFVRSYVSVERDILVRELDFSSQVISRDCRNNSAWCYRHFIFSSLKKMDMLREPNFLEEVEYIVNWLVFAPHNDSIWNYVISFFSKIMVRGDSDPSRETLATNLSFGHAPSSFRDAVDAIYESHRDSCHQVVFIKACMAYEEGDEDFVSDAFKLLQTVDPVRRFYWRWRADHPRV